MKKSTKGALAAAGAAILLVGGAGSLAYWTASAEVQGTGTITAGQLALTPTGPEGCDPWTLDTAEGGDGTFNPATMKIVPGDVVSTSCEFTITAEGEHLRAAFAVSTPSFAAGSATALVNAIEADVEATIGGAVVSEITEAHDGQTVAVDVTLTFLDTADNATQNLAAELENIAVTLQQVHN